MIRTLCAVALCARALCSKMNYSLRDNHLMSNERMDRDAENLLDDESLEGDFSSNEERAPIFTPLSVRFVCHVLGINTDSRWGMRVKWHHQNLTEQSTVTSHPVRPRSNISRGQSISAIRSLRSLSRGNQSGDFVFTQSPDAPLVAETFDYGTIFARSLEDLSFAQQHPTLQDARHLALHIAKRYASSLSFWLTADTMACVSSAGFLFSKDAFGATDFTLDALLPVLVSMTYVDGGKNIVNDDFKDDADLHVDTLCTRTSWMLAAAGVSQNLAVSGAELIVEFGRVEGSFSAALIAATLRTMSMLSTVSDSLCNFRSIPAALISGMSETAVLETWPVVSRSISLRALVLHVLAVRIYDQCGAADVKPHTGYISDDASFYEQGLQLVFAARSLAQGLSKSALLPVREQPSTVIMYVRNLIAAYVHFSVHGDELRHGFPSGHAMSPAWKSFGEAYLSEECGYSVRICLNNDHASVTVNNVMIPKKGIFSVPLWESHKRTLGEAHTTTGHGRHGFLASGLIDHALWSNAVSGRLIAVHSFSVHWESLRLGDFAGIAASAVRQAAGLFSESPQEVNVRRRDDPVVWQPPSDGFGTGIAATRTLAVTLAERWKFDRAAVYVAMQRLLQGSASALVQNGQWRRQGIQSSIIAEHILPPHDAHVGMALRCLCNDMLRAVHSGESTESMIDFVQAVHLEVHVLALERLPDTNGLALLGFDDVLASSQVRDALHCIAGEEPDIRSVCVAFRVLSMLTRPLPINTLGNHAVSNGASFKNRMWAALSGNKLQSAIGHCLPPVINNSSRQSSTVRSHYHDYLGITLGNMQLESMETQVGEKINNDISNDTATLALRHPPQTITEAISALQSYCGQKGTDADNISALLRVTSEDGKPRLSVVFLLFLSLSAMNALRKSSIVESEDIETVVLGSNAPRRDDISRRPFPVYTSIQHVPEQQDVAVENATHAPDFVDLSKDDQISSSNIDITDAPVISALPSGATRSVLELLHVRVFKVGSEWTALHVLETLTRLGYCPSVVEAVKLYWEKFANCVAVPVEHIHEFGHASSEMGVDLVTLAENAAFTECDIAITTPGVVPSALRVPLNPDMVLSILHDAVHMFAEIPQLDLEIFVECVNLALIHCSTIPHARALPTNRYDSRSS